MVYVVDNAKGVPSHKVGIVYCEREGKPGLYTTYIKKPANAGFLILIIFTILSVGLSL